MLSTQCAHQAKHFNALKVFGLSILLTAFSTLVSAESVRQPSIAIVIDDLGHHLKRGKTLVDMPYPLTLSFLPARKYTPQLAKSAHLAGKEVMLHAPMENSRKFQLGFGALTSEMNKAEIQGTLQACLATIPHMRGVNNHMGSVLTSNSVAMSWVMEIIARQPLYFLDSRTTAQSVAANVSTQFSIPTLVRDVFLDHLQTTAYIEEQFKKLITIARKNGTAIAIGHPHPVTIEFLERALPSLGEQGITLATASGIWQIRNPTQAMFDQGATATGSSVALASFPEGALSQTPSNN